MTMFADAKIIRINGADVVQYCPICKKMIRVIFGQEVCGCN